MMPLARENQQSTPRHVNSDVPFVCALGVIGGLYVLLILAMLLADVGFLIPGHGTGDVLRHPLRALSGTLANALSPLRTPEIRYALKLSLISCTVTAILSVYVAVPMGYLLSRFNFPLKGLMDAVLDIPIVLPPLVIGLSLLILFQTPAGRFVQRFIPVTYSIPSVILAQFAVACAFAVRTMRVTFDQLNPRTERVALTLGCNRFQAFWRVALPEARRGVLTAGTLAWARALGEFGPILVFSGATRMRTEVLPTSVFLELSVGNIEAAVAVSLLMVIAAVVVLLIVRFAGSETSFGRAVRP
ncbi:MAG: cysW 2 [Phycisphaerales bacterium]|nr:cysW 2 [Phycisphaerales bacterium]